MNTNSRLATNPITQIIATCSWMYLVLFWNKMDKQSGMKSNENAIYILIPKHNFHI